ncbi:MAG TPA: hypothetical protein VGX25_27050 [Actinophytocola sp.]|uniref:hypothetical protein n=1 Tax=Actinophytocola sp. TaxID=1872138 RepID=UPI002DDD81BE|nr:hypothetical protein [Actinophytocola sp.]HEV2783056.1 hypothetical protein [Actinophytocola sp.]
MFGLETPSPVPDKAIAMSVLSLATYPAPVGRSDTVDREHLETAVIEELRRFCRTHGFTRVVCYAPDDRLTLALLAKHGFTVESVISVDTTRIYGLSLHLPSTYTGDPYDGRHLLNWLAERLRLSVQNSDDTSSECFLRMDALNPDLVGTQLGSSQLPVKLSLHTKHDRGGPTHLRIQFGTTDSIESQFDLSIDDLREIAGVATLDMSFWPPPEDGASIAVEIRRDLYDRFDANRQNAYFDSGSYGTLLERATDRGLHPYIFFVDFATSTTNPRLIGLGRVRHVDRGSPDDLWERYGEYSSWSDADMFGRYRAIKRKMTAIIFDNVRRVDKIGAGLPVIGHSWTYVPSDQAYRVVRQVDR